MSRYRKLFLLTVVIFTVTMITCLVYVKRSTQTGQTIPSETVAITFTGGRTGSCTWIRLPDNTVLVIGASADTSAKDILESLKRYSVTSLDLFILPHPYSDVTAGADALLSNMAIKQLWIATEKPINRHQTATLAKANKLHVPISVVSRGDVMTIGPWKVEILSPPKDRVTGRPSAGNNSLVVRISKDNMSIIHLGGLGLNGQRALLTLPTVDILKCDILVLPRAASGPNILPELLAAAAATYIIIEGPTDDLDLETLSLASGSVIAISDAIEPPMFFLDTNGVRRIK